MNHGVAVLARTASHAFTGKDTGGGGGDSTGRNRCIRLGTGIGLSKGGRIAIDHRTQRVIAPNQMAHAASGAMAT